MLLAVIVLGVIAVFSLALAVGRALYVQELEAHNVALSAELVTERATSARWRQKYLELWRSAASGLADVRREVERFPGGSDVLQDDAVRLDGTGGGRKPGDTDLPAWDREEGE